MRRGDEGRWITVGAAGAFFSEVLVGAAFQDAALLGTGVAGLVGTVAFALLVRVVEWARDPPLRPPPVPLWGTPRLRALEDGLDAEFPPL